MTATWWTDLSTHNPIALRLLRETDWAGTCLGPAEHWPPELRTLVRLMVLSASPQHIVWGPERTLLYNDGYIPVLGDRHPAAFGASFERVWPDIWDELRPIVERAYAGTAQSFDDHPWLFDRGDHHEQVWISFAYTPVEDDSGDVVGFHCTFHETTATVLARQALNKATEELSALARERQLALDAARLGWWQLDVERGLVRHDERYAQIHGLSGPSPHRIEDVSALLHPDDSARVLAAVEAAMSPADAKPYFAECRIIRPDGTMLWVEGRGSATFEGEGAGRRVTHFAGTVADITERRVAENVLRENDARFRLMADTSPAVLWLTDADGQCTFLSRQWYALTGQTQDEALGLGWTTATHPDDQNHAARVFLAANAARTFFRTEYRLRTADGSYRWAIDLGQPWYTEHGEYAGMVGAVFDIDDRKRAEQALADESLRKDEFLAMLAHELRNPLAPIGTAAHLLKVAPDDPARIQHSAQIIERQVTHLTSLVDDLLDVSRVTRGLVSIEHQPVDIRAVVAAAVEQVRPLIQARRHELRTTVAAGPFIVVGDFNRLVQVVANLLNNAAKYTPQNGTIEIRIDQQAGDVVLEVRDTGVGIEKPLLPRVFELFTQAERTPDRSQGGLGIGLALVRSIVGLHGGSVVAKSDGPSTGSTFIVRLPESSRPPVEEPHVEAPARQAGCGRVLIVDDNVDAAETLAEVLRVMGHEVRVAEDGASGLAAAHGAAWDAFVLDIGLPDMTGLDLATELRTVPENRSAVFIALTGYGQSHDRALSKAAGFDHHMVKPPDVQRLLDVLGEHLACGTREPRQRGRC